MACCAVSGQGAGIAAAISVKLNKDLLDLDPLLIQKELKKQGARYWCTKSVPFLSRIVVI